jgi:hypothetical protein
MSRKLPVEILSHPAFELGLKTIIKNFSGIYALYQNERLYRVGLTTDLLWRIKSYLKAPHAGKWNKFVIFRIAKVNYLKDIETLVLEISHPPGNKVKGKVPKDADINRLLRKILRAHETVTKEIKKALR